MNVYTPKQVARVLKDCNVQIVTEIENDYLVYCPFHNNFRSPAAEVSKTMGRLYCFACHANKSLLEVVQHTTDKTPFQAIRLVNKYSETGNLAAEIEAALAPEPEFVAIDMDLIDRLHVQMLESPTAQSYMFSRGITIDSVKRFTIGYSEVRDMVTVPIWSHTGVCVGFVGRSIKDKVFKNSEHLPKSKVLFNLFHRRFCDTICVVESTFDAIRLEQCGQPAVATLGSGLSKGQLDVIERTFYNVLLIPDSDEAGDVMAEKLVKHMGSRVTVVKLPNGFKDVGDMDDETLRDFLKTIDPLEAFMKG